ncbi:MAG: aryl-sulfate sulfotransferase N-terminal domain-containing protein [Cetobacterium sp.]
MKKEKILILIISLFLILISFSVLFNKKEIEKKIEKNQKLSEIYIKNEKIKNKKIFSAKLKDDRLKLILENLSIDKMNIAIIILKNQELVNFLNDKKIESYIENIDYQKSLENVKVIKAIEDLSLLSPELGKYFREYIIKDNFDKIVKNIKNRPEVIKIKSRITKLLPIKNSEITFKQISEEKLIEISEMLSKSPLTVEFVEKKDLKKYNLEEIVEISKTLHKIGIVNPLLAIEIGEMLKGFDIRKASLYGDLYVKDEKFEKQIKKEYEKEVFTFDKPYLKYNPYGRTPLAYGLKYGKNEKIELLRITVLGKNGMPNFMYEKKYLPGELFPIVGLFPKTENIVVLEQINSETKKVEKVNKLKLKTYSIDDALPSIYIEKRISNSIQPGFNLVSYNLKSEGIPFAFDSLGNIRYILKTGKEMRKVKIEKQNLGIWKLKNDEDEFQLNLLGKILGRIGKENEDKNTMNQKSKYLVRNNNILTITSFREGAYPTGLFSEYGLDSKNEIFKAIIFYDKSSPEENLIEDGERVFLYEGDSDN